MGRESEQRLTAEHDANHALHEELLAAGDAKALDCETGNEL